MRFSCSNAPVSRVDLFRTPTALLHFASIDLRENEGKYNTYWKVRQRLVRQTACEICPRRRKRGKSNARSWFKTTHIRRGWSPDRSGWRFCTLIYFRGFYTLVNFILVHLSSSFVHLSTFERGVALLEEIRVDLSEIWQRSELRRVVSRLWYTYVYIYRNNN